MRTLCVIAAVGQALIFAYCVFALLLHFDVGLASTSDVVVALVAPLVTALSAVLLIKAAPLFGSLESE